jgi:GGDEF domain-containing protein
MLMVPIRQMDPIGALGLYWAHHREPTSTQVSLLQSLADSTAVALELCASRDGEHEARRQAHIDALTSIPNRRGWDSALEAALATGGQLSVIAIDLDGLKQVNDTDGHEAGDQLLRRACAVWGSRLRSGDIVARLGGDEFAVLLPEASLLTAQAVAARLGAGGVACSLGIAAWDQRETAAELVARADAALYNAKRAGRGCAVTADLR